MLFNKNRIRTLQIICKMKSHLWNQSWCPCTSRIWMSCRSCWSARCRMPPGCHWTGAGRPSPALSPPGQPRSSPKDIHCKRILAPSVADRHRFDVDPDLTFYFVADPDSDRILPPSFTHAVKSEYLKFNHGSFSLICFIFLVSVPSVIIFNILRQYIQIFW